MDRLTGWDKGNAYMLKCFEGDGCEDMETSKCNLCEHYLAIFSRLAAYEDTGLMPEEVQRWIPVTERLPESDADTKYLVTCKTKSGRQNINMAWFDGALWHGMGSMSGVTHWMPLPPLPREDKHERN